MRLRNSGFPSDLTFKLWTEQRGSDTLLGCGRSPTVLAFGCSPGVAHKFVLSASFELSAVEKAFGPQSVISIYNSPPEDLRRIIDLYGHQVSGSLKTFVFIGHANFPGGNDFLTTVFSDIRGSFHCLSPDAFVGILELSSIKTCYIAGCC